ncbi:hypothetical protein ES703_49413 [subsurface metagenome]
MKSEAEIRAEVRYWEGVLRGLQDAVSNLSDKIDTSEKRAVEARASVMSLNWVLLDSKKGAE